MTTARLSAHARERCAEMGVVTKRVKRIVRQPDVDYCSRDARGDARIAYRSDDPAIAVVYVPGDDGRPFVLTVVWHTPVPYARDGSRYIDLTTADERTTA